MNQETFDEIWGGTAREYSIDTDNMTRLLIVIIIITIKVHIISTHQPMYWTMNISSCTGIAAYLRTKQYILIDRT